MSSSTNTLWTDCNGYCGVLLLLFCFVCFGGLIFFFILSFIYKWHLVLLVLSITRDEIMPIDRKSKNCVRCFRRSLSNLKAGCLYPEHVLDVYALVLNRQVTEGIYLFSVRPVAVIQHFLLLQRGFCSTFQLLAAEILQVLPNPLPMP